MAGVAWHGGACMAGETAAAADDMHPTGMHSCLQISSVVTLETSGSQWTLLSTYS